MCWRFTKLWGPRRSCVLDRLRALRHTPAETSPMNRPTLSATLRTHRGLKTQDLRDAGSLPAIVYGLYEDPTSISVDRVAFVKLYNQVRHAGLLDLHIEGGKSFPVIIQDFAQHPVQDTVTHADFRIVDLKKAMDAVIALRFVGESKAVKALGGNLVVQLNELHVHAKPESLVPMIDVDMTPLETFDDVIYVTDVPLPDGVEVKEE